MKVIILSITQVKEKDAIISAINENELISFSVRGLFSEKSKTRSLNVPLTIADVDLEEGKYKYPILKSFTILYSPLISDTSLKFMTTINIMLEVTKRMLPDEDKYLMFTTLESAIRALKSSKDYYLVALSYINYVFKVSGYDFEVGQCVSCGSKKDIIAFSFQDGGFICKECMDSTINNDLSVKQMLLLRYIYLADSFDKLNKIEYDADDLLALLNRYFVYIYDNFGISLNSFKTL